MELLSDPGTWVALLTLTGLEIVLGVDNIIFISILSAKLPAEKQKRARNLGLLGAFVTRVLFLLSISWIMRLERDLFTIFRQGITGRDLILIIGGFFLIGKATHEIHDKLEGEEGTEEGTNARAARSLAAVVTQIMLIDIVFSIDSVVTAVGMAESVVIMIAANVIALAFMLLASGRLSAFVDKHPTIKMLALAFLVLIGTNLVAEGFGVHVPKGYTYSAMAFSVLVELLNLRLRASGTAKPVQLHGRLNDWTEE
jgi:predicted tellurium resistance membrane protein TerC